ncbi:MAG: response regulator [Methylococcales bacterium]|nr:response regulator [Methylococcales bacterium]
MVKVLAKPVKQSVLFGLCQRIFTQTLDIKTVKEPAVKTADDKPLANIKILVAEDHEINQVVIVNMLEILGASVKCVDNGLQVLNALDKEDYDVILMDCHMPKMDGFQATTAIRARESKDAHIPIIAVTADAMKEDQQKCLKIGMDAYIPKPFKSKDLSTTLLSLLNNENISTINVPSVENTEISTTIINQDFFNTQKKTIGKNFDGIVEKYINSLPNSIGEIKQAVAERDWAQVRHYCHKLRGASGIFGAEPLVENLRLIGEMLKNKQIITHDLIIELERIAEITTTDLLNQLKIK